MKIISKSMMAFFVAFLPFSLYGFGVWQCAGMILPELNPMCWDVCGFEMGAELLHLKKNDSSDNVDFTSDEIQGPIVLSSNMLDSRREWAYKIIGRVNLRDCKCVEVIWMPEVCWKNSKSALRHDYNLYSVYSRFGDPEFEGETGTDQSCEQLISLKSKLATVEVNVKKLWGICQGAFLYGYRYQCLDEDLQYNTIGESNAWYRSTTAVNNDMHGFQMGLEFCVPCSSCFSIGFFGKGTIYANCAERKFKATASSLVDSQHEKESNTRTSWGIDTGVKVSYEWSRTAQMYVGYQYLSYENVALALENFDANSPFISEKDKLPVNEGFLSFHGMTIGVNVIW